MTRLTLFALLLFACCTAQAQLDVSLEIKRRIFVRGEAVEATVTIRNLAGRDLNLHDMPGAQWFGFEVVRDGNTPVAPFNPKYRNQPINIPANETITRTVDLLGLYPVDAIGAYKIRAAIYLADTKKYYTSNDSPVDISDGHKVWQQVVGVPAGMVGEGELHRFTLLTFQVGKEMSIYCRVTDEADGSIFSTYPLGRMLGGAKPMVEFNNDNTLFVFHMTGPSQYALSKIGVNGEWLGQFMYDSPTGRATVRKRADGTMVVAGATRELEAEKGVPKGVPVLSDGPPVALPRVSDGPPAALPKR